ncbi:hypothetical protein PPERSA_08377 [Pseudocohnilembus persalinus]|uniref:Uncharacterized protein n=1 Tax=Pseudocohnilembus persalinus TaxID=266149 RepID=A0A0V0R742_PSEPJ|nr:hypothetical protein PPERSA_08377 [Pseudocohnilembus persalinus]|eukprot:KRX09976.1 hypothetical protein PPERSA_08377 [Pseudocohnilembus persalinus]
MAQQTQLPQYSNIQDNLFMEKIDVLVFGSQKFKIINDLLIQKSPHQTNQNQNIPKNKDKQLSFFDLLIPNRLKNVGKQQQQEKFDKDQNKLYQVGDFKKISTVLSTEQFWITFNFNLVNETVFDPYVQSFVNGPINILILAYNQQDNQERKQMEILFEKLAGQKSSQTLLYQSQVMLFNSGQSQGFNDNVMLGNMEVPKLGQFGLCLLVGYGNVPDKQKNFADSILFKEDKKYCNYINMEDPYQLKTGNSNINSENNSKSQQVVDIDLNKININEKTNLELNIKQILEIYEWIVNSHYINKYNIHLNDKITQQIKSDIEKHKFYYNQNKQSYPAVQKNYISNFYLNKLKNVNQITELLAEKCNIF